MWNKKYEVLLSKFTNLGKPSKGVSFAEFLGLTGLLANRKKNISLRVKHRKGEVLKRRR